MRLGPYLGRRSGALTVLAAGAAGPAAAAGTATALATARATGEPFSLVISLGVAGGFTGRADIGDLVVADAVVAADLGAESGLDTSACGPGQRPSPSTPSASGDFLSLDSLGLGPSVLTPHEGVVRRLVELLTGTGRTVTTGPVLSVSTVTGTDQRAAALALRFGPVAEAMEGYAVAVAASAFNTPFAEVRAISNLVGRRDRSAWDLPRAFAGLSAATAGLAAGIDALTAVLETPGSAEPARPVPGPGMS